MDHVSLADIRAAYGLRDEWFDRATNPGRRLAAHGVREGITFYFTGSEAVEGRPAYWAYIMDRGLEVSPIGTTPFRTQVGATAMVHKAFACAWTGSLVSHIVPIVRAVRDINRAGADGWAQSARCALRWLGPEASLLWTDATGRPRIDRPLSIAREMGFRV